MWLLRILTNNAWCGVIPVKEKYLTPEGFKGKGPDAYVRALNNTDRKMQGLRVKTGNNGTLGTHINTEIRRYEPDRLVRTVQKEESCLTHNLVLIHCSWFV